MLLRDYLQERDLKQNRINYSISDLLIEVGIDPDTTERLDFYKHIKTCMNISQEHHLGGQYISTRRARDIICDWLNEE